MGSIIRFNVDSFNTSLDILSTIDIIENNIVFELFIEDSLFYLLILAILIEFKQEVFKIDDYNMILENFKRPKDIMKSYYKSWCIICHKKRLKI